MAHAHLLHPKTFLLGKEREREIRGWLSRNLLSMEHNTKSTQEFIEGFSFLRKSLLKILIIQNYLRHSICSQMFKSDLK